MKLSDFISRARQSAFHLRVLNLFLPRVIPFHRPHGFRVVALTETTIRTSLPYRRSNFNHIRGIHACALATLSEFTTGFLLISRLDPAKYRIILRRLEMEYHYQAKQKVTASFELSDEWLNSSVFQPLLNQDAIEIPCTVLIHDTENHLISTGVVYWQVKEWAKVRTRV